MERRDERSEARRRRDSRRERVRNHWNPKERRDRSRRNAETGHRIRGGIPWRKEWLGGRDAD